MKATLILMFLVFTVCYALPRGTTTDTYPDGGIIVGHAPTGTLPQHNEPEILSNTPSRDEWVPVDSLHFDTILRAGSYMSLQYDPDSHQATQVSNLGELIPESIAAIHKSPSWVRTDLENVLNQLTSAKQLIFAGVINNAVDPYIDEIAFCIAHSSVQYLTTNYANPLLMTENATMLYQIDTDLQYVEIINYGSSTTRDDYYSTTRYRRMNADSTITYVEVPRDIYYWYIVHPKITDEIPAYINPTIIESNSSHTNNIAAPPTGVFWRSFLYTVQQDTLPVLSQMLANCQTVRNWNGAPGDAITAIQDWINATISFTSNTERPHQPVRIYAKHYGRCGEHADYTAAAARLALIPCTSIQAISVDHTWNEFWDENWVHWEPVNHSINDPLCYENGWGWTFGSVFETRSDGFLTPITDRYSDGVATINIQVADSLQHPVDGARILLMMNDAGTLKFDMQGITKNDGTCSFIVGENRHYAVRADTQIGSLPAISGQYLDVIDNSVDGAVYNCLLTIPSEMPTIGVSLVVPPPVNPNYRIVTSLSVTKQVLSSTVMWDDITYAVSRPYIYKTIEETGQANFMLMDSDNFMFYQVGLIGDAYDYASTFTQEIGNYLVPSESIWYASADNLNHIRNGQYVTGSIKLEHLQVANDDPVVTANELKLYANYPNPFNPNTMIKFQLPQASVVDLSIYNIRGQKIRTLSHGLTEAGLHQFTWNGTDENGNAVGSGLYFYRLESGNRHFTQKMILLK